MLKSSFQYVMRFAYTFVLRLKTVSRFLGFCGFFVMQIFLSAFFSSEAQDFCVINDLLCVCGLFFSTSVNDLKISLAFRY